MTIEVEIAGTGQIVEFPDGTPPEVIQQSLSQFAQQPQEQGVGSMLLGGANILASGVAGAGEQVIEGLSELGGVITGRGPEQSIQSAQALTEAIPDIPLGEDAQQLIQNISERFNASPQVVQDIFNFVTHNISALPETAGDIGQKIGEPIGLGATLGSVASAIPAGLESVAGLRGARVVGAAIPDVPDLSGVPGAAVELFQKQSPTKQKISELIKGGSTDVDTARFQLAKPTAQGTARVKADVLARDAITQGFDEGVIATVKGASQTDKIAMKKMVNIMQRGKKNARFAATNRPSDVLGESLMKRLSVVQGANKAAGQQLDTVAKSLKGESLDFEPIGTQFVNDLSNMGISVTDDLKLNFKGSDVEGLGGPERAITQIFNRMKSANVNDAFSAHRLKRFIDEQVTFGKNAEGLAGRAEIVLKSLRRDIDQQLDDSFPEYNRINTAYSETIGALDAFQDVAGRKMNLTGPNATKATGTLLRRILSNAQSRITLLDSIDDIEKVAEKFKNFKSVDTSGRLIEGPARKKFDDDLLNQVLFVDELDSVFGPTARTSLQGQLQQAAARTVEAKASPLTAVVRAGGALADKARGINEEGAFKAIRGLLQR